MPAHYLTWWNAPHVVGSALSGCANGMGAAQVTCMPVLHSTDQTRPKEVPNSCSNKFCLSDASSLRRSAMTLL